MFITFEGIDGSGKSTQSKLLTATLREKGYEVLLTREPGGTQIGDQIRTILLDDMTNSAMTPQAELLLFCASRAQLVGEVIRPFVAKGGIVICDRYADSTLAYQVWAWLRLKNPAPNSTICYRWFSAECHSIS
jgi:dTMP kinase